jgi:hypothetical protein
VRGGGKVHALLWSVSATDDVEYSESVISHHVMIVELHRRLQ